MQQEHPLSKLRIQNPLLKPLKMLQEESKPDSVLLRLKSYEGEFYPAFAEASAKQVRNLSRL